ncbi:MAG: hypothetical protein A3B70_06720 [Deltaproteobacteria bacterium RIFCSPHIGHO2_02_FULL_40_11]|nr:MAG: hypothetical protein A3B70_06720 [Deltaproteobacteria bacterium RIFCSPHIGHO2_02_FULL_40_11]
MKSKAVYFFFVLLIPAFAGMTLAFAKTPPPKNTPKMDFKTCATSECHTDIYKIEHKHSPIKAGGCHLCHEPILGTHKFKLFENRQKMCTDCHEDMAKKNFGKTKGQFTLRTENHLFATHPLDTLLRPETKEKFEKTGLKLHQGKMECLTCHNPHGTNQTHLLRNIPTKGKQAALCFTCHAPKFTANTHPMKNDQCFDCHGFHKAKFQSTLIKFEKKGEDFICMDCHSEKKSLSDTKHDGFKFSKSNKTHAQNTFTLPKHMFTQCQTCHSMHKSHTKGALLVSKKKSDPKTHSVDSLCLGCHQNKDTKEITQIKTHFKHIPIQLSSVTDPETQEEYTPRFYTDKGEKTKSPTGEFYLSCSTCHNPHEWHFNPDMPKDVQGTIDNSFLFSSKKTILFCAQCHDEEAYDLYTKFHFRKKKETQEGSK